ncbi:chemotaxis protein CheW [Uliginosibacterium sediminicola]|jgi:purine-binding chemotaxis protein CheW|uniref:Chemotaxis protein CheW n=1 Tax=Uliginosibacterium sediminicola TaxID=2024550 RepID=A0ABU9Z3L4_9RHOO
MLQTADSGFGQPGELPAHSDQYLSFTLGHEEYAIDILKVQEIRGYDAVTRIAGAPEFIKGVINLRGIIVPIVDLRIKFGIGSFDYTAFTVVIILKVGARVIGIVVDSVCDVIDLSMSAIKPAPEFAAMVGSEFIAGLASLQERMLIVLDIERMLLSTDLGLVDQDLH